MAKWFAVIVLALVAFQCLAEEKAENFYDGTDVASLGDDTFDKFLADHPEGVLVEFYAPWCGHCKALKPEYIAAAAELKGVAALVAVDATGARALAEKYAVQGFPTLMWMRGGKSSAYNGGRDKESIVKFVKKQLLPAIVEVASAEKLEELKKEREVVVIFAADEKTRPVIADAAEKLRNDDAIVVGEVKDAAAFKLKAPGLKVITADFGEQELAVDEKTTVEQITQFVDKYSLPLMGAISSENYERFFNKKMPMFWLFCDDEADKEVASNVREAAKAFIGKVLFVRLSSKDHASHAENFGLSGKFPAAVYADENLKYPYDQKPFDTAAVSQFVSDVLAGKVEPFYRSEPIPEKNDAPVKVIVGKTFKPMVEESDDDVLIMFYAPWCPHCKKLHPIFDELAEAAASVPKLIIAKMDATANDPPASYDIQGFPTLYFVGKEDKKAKPVQYEGARTLDGFIQFLREHARNGKELSPPSPLAKKINKFLGDWKDFEANIKELIAENKKLRQYAPKEEKAEAPAAEKAEKEEPFEMPDLGDLHMPDMEGGHDEL